jgi:hypothetical protein
MHTEAVVGAADRVIIAVRGKRVHHDHILERSARLIAYQVVEAAVPTVAIGLQ